MSWFICTDSEGNDVCIIQHGSHYAVTVAGEIETEHQTYEEARQEIKETYNC